jgi:hypothetical protein
VSLDWHQTRKWIQAFDVHFDLEFNVKKNETVTITDKNLLIFSFLSTSSRDRECHKSKREIEFSNHVTINHARCKTLEDCWCCFFYLILFFPQCQFRLSTSLGSFFKEHHLTAHLKILYLTSQSIYSLPNGYNLFSIPLKLNSHTHATDKIFSLAKLQNCERGIAWCFIDEASRVIDVVTSIDFPPFSFFFFFFSLARSHLSTKTVLLLSLSLKCCKSEKYFFLLIVSFEHFEKCFVVRLVMEEEKTIRTSGEWIKLERWKKVQKKVERESERKTVKIASFCNELVAVDLIWFAHSSIKHEIWREREKCRKREQVAKTI